MTANRIDINALAETRAKGLLVLSLSRRSDIALQETGGIGFDFLVRVLENGTLNTNRVFWIELKASVREAHGPRVILSKSLAATYAESPLPLCLFFYAMNDDIGYYAWMIRPTVTRIGRPELAVNPRLLTRRNANVEFGPEDFTKVDDDGLRQLIDDVNSWYDARHTFREAA